MIRTFFILLLCLPFCLHLTAQEESEGEREYIYDLQFGMLAGGEIENETFYYRPGLMAQGAILTPISPWVDLGVGVGLQSFENETILPFFLDVEAQLKEGPRSNHIRLNIGSSLGWSSFYRDLPAYEYEGGFYFSTYHQMAFPLSKRTALLVALGYIHQRGEIEFDSGLDEELEEGFALDFLTIRTGIRF
ncbi:MAG: hypothetical protein HKN79_08245 [Flavobacteriales bacterium]|nr:hypothetical protein [Flavobacteriales bacterium]